MTRSTDKTLTYFTVSPLFSNGTVDFNNTFRHTDRDACADYRRVFGKGIFGTNGWTQVVEHTVEYSTGGVCGRGSYFGREMKIAKYAQDEERSKIARTVDLVDWFFVRRDNRFVKTSEYLQRPTETRPTR